MQKTWQSLVLLTDFGKGDHTLCQILLLFSKVEPFLSHDLSLKPGPENDPVGRLKNETSRRFTFFGNYGLSCKRTVLMCPCIDKTSSFILVCFEICNRT